MTTRWSDALWTHPDLPSWPPAYGWAEPVLALYAQTAEEFGSAPNVSTQGGYWFARDTAGVWHVVPDIEVDRARFGAAAEFARTFRAATAHI